MASQRPIRGNRPRVMRIRTLLPAALVLAAPLAAIACTGGSGPPAAPADDAELVLGRTVYAGNCAPCHGPNGGGGVGPQLSGGRLLANVPDPADEVAIVINGRKQMPAFNQKLTPEQVSAVVRYTREVIARQ